MRSTLVSALAAMLLAGVPAAGGAGWTQWGGPGRDFRVAAGELAERWPADGPPRLWSRELGAGYSAVLYDGVVLLGIALFGDWPLERAVLAATFLNPVDLGRVLLLLRFDLSALSGYTGAVFARFFAGGTGLLLSVAGLALWAALPLAWGARRFARKDF